MFEWILLAIGVVGFGLASYWDVKTTEFPDWLPYVMIVLALIIKGVHSFMDWDIWIILSSAMAGCGLLALGYAMYFLKQWGDGDAWLLGALGFLFPASSLLIRPLVYPFMFVMLFNFFIVSFFYLIAYTMAVGLRNRRIMKKFTSEIKDRAKGMAAVVAGFTVACMVLIFYLSYSFGMPPPYRLLIFPPFLLAILVFVYYGKFVEANIFKKKIPARKLRMGDVPIDEKWRVLTEKEVARIKKRGGDIWIKEGARMAPAFLITLLISVFWGFILL